MGECWLFLFLFSFWVIDFLYMVYIILKTQKSLQSRRMFLLLFLSQDRKQQLCNRFPLLGSPESKCRCSFLQEWKCTLFAAPEFLIEMTHFCNLPLTADRILRDHYFLFYSLLCICMDVSVKPFLHVFQLKILRQNPSLFLQLPQVVQSHLPSPQTPARQLSMFP